METTTMATILENIGLFFTEAISWLGDVIAVVVESPLLLIMVAGVTLTGFAVGLVRRLIRL